MIKVIGISLLDGKEVPVGINGFGRMGFCTLRQCVESRDFRVCAINASRTPEQIAYLFRYDSVHGPFHGTIEWDEESVTINNQQIRVVNEREPAKIPWEELGVEYVIDTTGKFLTTEAASAHLIGGAKKVIISAPAKDGNETPMFVYGVNHRSYEPDMKVVSNASCTTNCLAPLAKIIEDAYGIESGIMTTVHAMTSKQPSVDGFNAKDLRIGRSGQNIIPTSTGAAKAVGRVIPELSGKLTGMAFRVPLQNCSVVDLTLNLKTPTTYQDICYVVAGASMNEMYGVVEYCDNYFVSSDFNHCSIPCNFDVKAGFMLTPTFAKLIAWYDNEWSYIAQLLKLARYMYARDNL